MYLSSTRGPFLARREGGGKGAREGASHLFARAMVLARNRRNAVRHCTRKQEKARVARENLEIDKKKKKKIKYRPRFSP